MSKPLSEMTLEELWVLFPIILSAHNSDWAKWYSEEKKRLQSCLDTSQFRISHIGSTSIDIIWAKPTIDILLEVPKDAAMECVKDALCTIGYFCMCESDNRKDFNRGYTENGFADKVFHLHLRYFGDNDELYFRDYMNDNPNLAKQYEKLKLSLWKQFEHNRDAYTDAKGDFVRKYSRIARAVYRNRY